MLSTSDGGSGSANAIFDGRGMLSTSSGDLARIVSVLIVGSDGTHRIVRVWPSGHVEAVAPRGSV
jgi:hypothetical protein